MFEVIHRPRLQEAANLRLLAERDPKLNGKERVQLARESNAIVEAVCLEQQYAAVDALVLASLAHVYSAIGKMQDSGFRLSPSQGASAAAGTGTGTAPLSNGDVAAASAAAATAVGGAAAAPVAPVAAQAAEGAGTAAQAPNAPDLSYINPLDEIPRPLHRLVTPRYSRLLKPWWCVPCFLVVVRFA